MTGNIGNAINSDVVQLQIDGGEIILLFDIDFGKTPVRQRRSTRAGKLDTYGPPLEDFFASATVDKATYDVIDAASTQDARKAYPQVACIITGLNLGGSAPNDLIVNATGEIPQMRVLAPGNGQDTTIRFQFIGNSTGFVTP